MVVVSSLCGTLLQERRFELFLVSALVGPEEKQIKKKKNYICSPFNFLSDRSCIT